MQRAFELRQKGKIHAAEQTLACNRTTKTGLTKRIKKEG